MLNTTEILSIAFLRVFREQVNSIKDRYPDEPWLKHLISRADMSIRHAEMKIFMPFLDWEEDSEELYKLTRMLKYRLSPIDFLFFKALFTENDQERVFLLQQAQMMEPESLRLHVMTYFMSTDFEEAPDLVLQHLDSLPAYRACDAVYNFLFILKLLRRLEQKNEEFDVEKLTEFLNREGLPPSVMLSILYHIMEKVEVSETRRILENLNIPYQNNNGIYFLVNAYVYSEMEEYDTALHWFEKLELEESKLPQEIQLVFLHRYCRVQMNTGNAGKAIPMLREIVFSEKYNTCGCDAYFHSIVDLASYYVKSGQTEEAGEVLSILDVVLEIVIEELRGTEFLLLMAEYHMLIDCWEKALYWYRQAYKVGGDREIADKIRALEEGL